jgi:hydrogenase small subunit
VGLLPRKEEIVPFRPRDFLRLADKRGATDVYAAFGSELDRLFAQAVDGDLHVVWLQGASDSGCTVSLLRNSGQDLVEVIVKFRKAVDFYPTLMIPSSDRALRSLGNALAGRAPLDLLIVEGDDPPRSLCVHGHDPARLVPFETWVRDLAAAAKIVISVGTCADGVSRLAGGTAVLNVPGCPAPADRVLLTIATVLSGAFPGLRVGRGSEVLFHPEFRALFRGCDPLDN